MTRLLLDSIEPKQNFSLVLIVDVFCWQEKFGSEHSTYHVVQQNNREVTRKQQKHSLKISKIKQKIFWGDQKTLEHQILSLKRTETKAIWRWPENSKNIL